MTVLHNASSVARNGECPRTSVRRRKGENLQGYVRLSRWGREKRKEIIVRLREEGGAVGL